LAGEQISKTNWLYTSCHRIATDVRAMKSARHEDAFTPHDATTLPSRRENLVEAFGDFHGDLLRVLEAVDDVSVWPIYDRERNDRWSGGRLVLLGDACHPVPPFMAAGGALAVEDAAILSRCLATFDDPADAFRCYQATRITRVIDVQRISIENSWMGGPTETDWFYCYDACLAPLGPSAHK
jgi:6-hydroxynicotinate 3-monooxygenase